MDRVFIRWMSSVFSGWFKQFLCSQKSCAWEQQFSYTDRRFPIDFGDVQYKWGLLTEHFWMYNDDDNGKCRYSRWLCCSTSAAYLTNCLTWSSNSTSSGGLIRMLSSEQTPRCPSIGTHLQFLPNLGVWNLCSVKTFVYSRWPDLIWSASCLVMQNTLNAWLHVTVISAFPVMKRPSKLLFSPASKISPFQQWKLWCSLDLLWVRVQLRPLMSRYNSW